MSKFSFARAVKTLLRKVPRRKKTTVSAPKSNYTAPSENYNDAVTSQSTQQSVEIKRGVTTTAGGYIHRKISTTAQFSLNLHFRSGTHVSWKSGKRPVVMDNQELAQILIRGAKNIPARSIFNQFVSDKKSEILGIITSNMDFENGNNYDKMSEEIRQLMVDWTVQGNVRPANDAIYASEKARAGLSTSPFVATGDLLDALEVTYD